MIEHQWKEVSKIDSVKEEGVGSEEQIGTLKSQIDSLRHRASYCAIIWRVHVVKRLLLFFL